jgi:PIN domain nuclease of toxin-antitoxin system
VRVLLDTHLLLWALAQPAKLPAKARKLIEGAEVMVSAASIWEIGIKSALGKLTLGPRAILAAVEPTGFSLLAVTCEHAAKVSELPPLHRDPFDRMLVAQALCEPLILLTNDHVLGGYGSCVTLV